MSGREHDCAGPMKARLAHGQRSENSSRDSRRTRTNAFVRLTLLLIVVLSICFGENQDYEPAPAGTVKMALPEGSLRTYRANTDLVLVPVTVTDQEGRPVLGLNKESFTVYENKRLQSIAHLSMDDAPISLGVILDSSGSMNQKLEITRKAIIRFLGDSGPQDEFFLVSVNSRPGLVSNFTSSVDELQRYISTVSPEGATSLLDAVYLGLNQMRRAKNQRKALLIVSDGQDNHSRYNAREVASLASESDVQIFALGVEERLVFRGTPTEKANREGMRLLATLTDVSGGRMLRIRNSKMMEDAAQKLASLLRNQYLLAYRSSNRVLDGKWRAIKVKVAAPQSASRLLVYAKTGYYSAAR